MLRSVAILGTILATAGAARAQDVPTLARSQRWAEATAAAAALPDPLVGRLVAYWRALTPHADDVAAIDAFRITNPDWPQPALLQRRREEAMAAEPDDSAVLAAAARERPTGAAALARWAEALARHGEPDAATGAARAAWLDLPPDPPAEAEFLRRWGPSLRPADHWGRFDRLAWSDTAAAARALPLLDSADRARAAARLALRRDEANAPALLAALPPEVAADPALTLEHVRWLRRAHRDTEAAALLLRDGVAAERALPEAHRAAIWAERDTVARRRLRVGDAAGAYALVAETGQSAAETVADAAFLAGWIALRRLERPDDARRHFAALRSVSRAVVSQARAHEWLARADAALGDAAAARVERTAAAAWPTTYYGQVAALAGGESEAALAARLAALRDPPWSESEAADLLAGDLARAPVLLAGWGEPGRGAGFLLRLGDLATAPADQAVIARLALRLGLPATAVALARRAGRLGVVLPESGWPAAAAIGADSPVEPALAQAIIRQESSFDPGTISPAGARGLMQLMPATAEATGRDLGLVVAADALIADPALNVRLGSTYLAGLLARFGGSLPLAIAAYNAGPGRVDEWLATNGDPRGGAVDMVDWIELIPLAETRNYVQRVLENLAVYRARLPGHAAPEPAPATPSSPRSPA